MSSEYVIYDPAFDQFYDGIMWDSLPEVVKEQCSLTKVPQID